MPTFCRGWGGASPLMPPRIFVRVAASMVYDFFYERCGTCARGLAMELFLVRRSDRAPCALLARAFEITRAGSGAAIVRGRDARCRRKRSNIWSTKAGAARPLYRYLGTPTPAGRGRRLPPNATAAKERTRVCYLTHGSGASGVCASVFSRAPSRRRARRS